MDHNPLQGYEIIGINGRCADPERILTKTAGKAHWNEGWAKNDTKSRVGTLVEYSRHNPRGTFVFESNIYIAPGPSLTWLILFCTPQPYTHLKLADGVSSPLSSHIPFSL